MTEDIPRPCEAIKEPVIHAVLAEPNDLQILCSTLEQLEKIERMGLDSNLKSIGIFNGAIEAVVEKIVLDEAKDPEKR
jgi:hypothetical protein